VNEKERRLTLMEAVFFFLEICYKQKPIEFFVTHRKTIYWCHIYIAKNTFEDKINEMFQRKKPWLKWMSPHARAKFATSDTKSSASFLL
jgi:hypothetical protein